ncbi:MAG: histidine triad nucleotide-binding protein [Syntrophomonadaceae bacterium]|nr:histidine triad nucleotide-binding protein [Syntrophomonadaceae bacterium]
MPETKDCIFCKIIAGEIPSKIVFQDELLIAIEDINPTAPVHILIIPRKHIASLNEVNNSHSEILSHIQIQAAQIAREMKIDQEGYRLLNNCGEWGGQTVMHLHYHLLGGREMTWPAG